MHFCEYSPSSLLILIKLIDAHHLGNFPYFIGTKEDIAVILSRC